MSEATSIALITYDSCRYDVILDADTPVLDSFAEVVPAQSPANFTYAAHLAFFAGILPNTDRDQPYHNRFNRQLVGLVDVGETQVVKDAELTVTSNENLISGFRDRGYQTIGTGAMNWFRQEPLRTGFEDFAFTGTDAEAQVDFVLSRLRPSQPSFTFVNFGETHAPYTYRGKKSRCSVDVRARAITSWPPVERGPVGRDNEAFAHQVEAAEFLDRQLGRLLSALPASTIVIVCADHGECFGEDGYWGHGFNHPVVLEVPLAIFALDGRSLL